MIREILHKLGWCNWEYLGGTDDIKQCGICHKYWLDGGNVDYEGRASDKLEVDYLLMKRAKYRKESYESYRKHRENMQTELNEAMK